MFNIDGEEQEAIRQVKAEGHIAQSLPRKSEGSIEVMRMTNGRPVTGEWELICVGFYEAWLDGDDVPISWENAFSEGLDDDE